MPHSHSFLPGLFTKTINFVIHFSMQHLIVNIDFSNYSLANFLSALFRMKKKHFGNHVSSAETNISIVLKGNKVQACNVLNIRRVIELQMLHIKK